MRKLSDENKIKFESSLKKANCTAITEACNEGRVGADVADKLFIRKYKLLYDRAFSLGNKTGEKSLSSSHG